MPADWFQSGNDGLSGKHPVGHDPVEAQGAGCDRGDRAVLGIARGRDVPAPGRLAQLPHRGRKDRRRHLARVGARQDENESRAAAIFMESPPPGRPE